MHTRSSENRFQFYLFLILFGGVSLLTFFIFKPFLTVLFLAFILAVVLYPVYKRILRWVGRPTIAALLVILITVAVIVGPLAAIGIQVFNEIGNTYLSIVSAPEGDRLLGDATRYIERPIQVIFPDFSLDLRYYLEDLLGWMIDNIGPIFSRTAQVVLSTIFTIIGLFFFLRDGTYLRDALIRMSPLGTARDMIVIKNLQKSIRSVVAGSVLVAMVQSILVGIGLAIFGVPNPTLWGTFALFTAFIPGVGTSLVLAPAVIYLIAMGHLLSGLGLLVWGILLVGLADNILIPLFYGRDVPVHPLFILFSVLGGLLFFGPIGFLFGPIIVSLFVSLLEIYQVLIKGENERL